MMTLILKRGECWNKSLALGRSSKDTQIDADELGRSIQQTKTNTASGSCGWTQPDLTCVPKPLLSQLVELWNAFTDGKSSWPAALNFAKIVTPKMKNITLPMMDVRPITILLLLYRILSKTWTKK